MHPSLKDFKAINGKSIEKLKLDSDFMCFFCVSTYIVKQEHLIITHSRECVCVHASVCVCEHTWVCSALCLAVNSKL